MGFISHNERNLKLKKIYILLSGTGTFPAKVIRKIKGGKFSHTSLALTPQTDGFYSYARRRLHNLLVAGFVTENIHTHVFAQYPDAPCALYALTISDEGYEKIREMIDYCQANYKKAKYNFIGLFALGFGIKIKCKYRYTCSQFVAVLLERSGDVKLPKDPYLMVPTDFMKIDGIELIYEGALKDCNFDADTLAQA